MKTIETINFHFRELEWSVLSTWGQWTHTVIISYKPVPPKSSFPWSDLSRDVSVREIHYQSPNNAKWSEPLSRAHSTCTRSKTYYYLLATKRYFLLGYSAAVTPVISTPKVAQLLERDMHLCVALSDRLPMALPSVGLWLSQTVKMHLFGQSLLHAQWWVWVRLWNPFLSRI